VVVAVVVVMAMAALLLRSAHPEEKRSLIKCFTLSMNMHQKRSRREHIHTTTKSRVIDLPVENEHLF